MADTRKSDEHAQVAKAVVAKLPKALRDGAEVVDGGGRYTLVKIGGRTVASIRAKNSRVTLLHDGSAESTARIAETIATAAATEKAEPKPKPADTD